MQQDNHNIASNITDIQVWETNFLWESTVKKIVLDLTVVFDFNENKRKVKWKPFIWTKVNVKVHKSQTILILF